jgi:general secretion pathway protein A
MYEQFFGLTREPFSVAPDPHFIYMSPKHREAIGHLIYGLRRGAGFVLLTGEIGAGKTTVWRSFLERLPSNFDVAYVVNPKLHVNALLTRVCEDLRIELPAGAVDLIDAIHGHLLLAFAAGRRTLIVVDEAQALSTEVLEQLRLLTNLDSTGGKLQVLLIGQPELRTMLQQPALEPLAQRVVARFHLTALSEDETARYIAHRLTVAGLVGQVPFDDAALRLVHRLCGGVPRRINVLCDRALLTAQLAASMRIDPSIIERAADDVFGVAPAAALPPPPVHQESRPRWSAMVAVAVGVLAVGALLVPDVVPKVLSIVAAAASPRAARRTAGLPNSAAPLPTAVRAAATPTTPAPFAPAPTASFALPTTTLTTLVAAAPLDAQRGEQPPAKPASARQLSNLDAVFATAASDESTAWRTLSSLWGITLDPGEPCAVAAKQGLRCYRTKSGLGPIRQLSRPGILILSDEHGRVAYALLVGLAEDGVTFRSSDVEQTVPLTALARWRGEFATFWRPPPGYRDAEPVSATGALAPWLGERLAMVDEESAPPIGAEALASRVFAFQLAQGLNPDGVAGPLTLMQLNRLSGVDEPRLQLNR